MAFPERPPNLQGSTFLPFELGTDLLKPQADYPQYPAQALSKIVPGLDIAGLDLLEKFLQCDPSKRISAKDALAHPYFADVPEAVKSLK